MEQKLFCNLTKEQASLYEAVLKDVNEQLKQTEGIQRKGVILATLTKLKQICNHPRQFLQDESEFTASRSHKLSRLLEMLDEVVQERESALVFSQFREINYPDEGFSNGLDDIVAIGNAVFFSLRGFKVESENHADEVFVGLCLFPSEGSSPGHLALPRLQTSFVFCLVRNRPTGQREFKEQHRLGALTRSGLNERGQYRAGVHL